jgi:hypothetical protein
MHTGFRFVNLKERGISKDVGVDGEYSIETDLKETRLENVDWIHLFQDGLLL